MTPPRLWRVLLRRSVPGHRREDIDADLTEEFSARAAGGASRRARHWYRRQALGFLAAWLGRPRLSRWITVSDVRLAIRLARRQPVATVTSILALAAAIGLSAGAFTFARGFVFPGIDLPGGARLHQIRMARTASGGTEHARAREVIAWMSEARTAESVGAFQFVSPPMQIDEEAPRPVDAARVTPDAFARLAPPPLRGRLLTASDARPGAARVVVIGELLWRRRFHAAESAVGRTVRIAGDSHRIVGVLPEGFGFPVMQQAWLALPLEALAAETSAGLTVSGGAPRLVPWVVLAPNASRAAAEAEFTSLARGVAPEAERAGTSLAVLPYVEGFTGGVATPVAALALTLLLAFLCGVSLNVASLTLARCASRARELALRAALGASRGRIVAQICLESLVVSVTAAAIGVLALERTLDVVQARIGTAGPFWLDLSLSPWTVLYVTILAVIASALAGVVPALRVTRGGTARTIATDGNARLTPIALGRFTSALLAAQLAASLALLVTAGLLAEGLQALSTSPGVPGEGRIVTAVLYRDPAMSGVRAPWGSDDLHALRVSLERALAALPGAERAAVSLTLPRTDAEIDRVDVEGRAVLPVRVQAVMAGPGLLEVLSVRPIAGRTLDDADARPSASRVAVVSERFARQAFGGETAIGRRIRWAPDTNARATPWMQIVGVVPDVGMNPGDRTTHGEVFYPLVGTDFMYAAVRTTTAAAAITPALRAAIAAVDSRIRVTDIQSLADVGWEARATLAAGAGALTLLGGLALLLSLAGLYALASLSVTSRTREIGVRLALGATRGQVLAPVFRRTTWQLGLGTVAGIALAVLLSQALTALPFAVPGSIGLAVPAGAFLLIGAGVLATWIPAQRALRITPIEALRSE